MSANRTVAAKLYNELKKRINKLSFSHRAQILNVDDFDKLPEAVQQVVVDALDAAQKS